MPPNKTLADKQKPGVKGDKSRISVLVCTNSDGSDKLPALFIGSSAQPTSFKRKKAHDYGLQYTHNKNAWMTGTIFGDWLQRIDTNFRKEERHVLLLLDNFSGH